MNRNARICLLLLGAMILVGLSCLWFGSDGSAGDIDVDADAAIGSGAAAPKQHVFARQQERNEGLSSGAGALSAPDSKASLPPPTAGEDDAIDEEERLVGDFDAMTDAFIAPLPLGKGVAMEQVSMFREKFSRLPPKRKRECLHRALNLIPDENVMLLAGILMDKSQEPELTGLVFNDILNRDESVKQPMLQQIFKDREHPNWADAAWILDVTGQLPNAQNPGL